MRIGLLIGGAINDTGYRGELEMSVLFVALPVAILLGAAALVACVRCIRGGQYDDLETPAVRILVDEKPVRQISNGCGSK